MEKIIGLLILVVLSVLTYLFYVFLFYILLLLVQLGGLDINFNVWIGGVILMVIHGLFKI